MTTTEPATESTQPPTIQPTPPTTTAITWQEAWAECHAAIVSHPSYESATRDAAYTLQSMIGDARAIPFDRIRTLLAAWDGAVDYCRKAQYVTAYPESYHREGAAFVRTCLARWEATA